MTHDRCKGREPRCVLRRRAGARRRFARDRGGRDRRHRRRQRRRQDLADPHHRRHAQAGARPHFFPRPDIAGWPSHKVCDLGIGQVAEGRQVFPSLSVAENLAMGAMLPRARASTRAQSAKGLCAVSGAGRAPQQAGRHAVRRRTADARHRPLPDGRAGTW